MRTGEAIVERPHESSQLAPSIYDPAVDVPLSRAKAPSVLALPAVHLQTMEQHAVIQVLYNTPVGDDREHRERQVKLLAAAAAQHIAVALHNFEQLTQGLDRYAPQGDRSHTQSPEEGIANNPSAYGDTRRTIRASGAGRDLQEVQQDGGEGKRGGLWVDVSTPKT